MVFLAGQVLGLILLGVTVWRSGFPGLAAVGFGAFPLAAKMTEVTVGAHGSVVSHVLPLIALGAIARKLWALSDEPAVR